MNKELIIAGAQEYAATVGAPSTAEGATDPQDLAAGSIGVYANIDGETVLLIEDGAAPATVTGGKLAIAASGVLAAFEKRIESFFIAEGNANGPILSGPIPLDGTKVAKFSSDEYSAGTAQSISVGNTSNALAKPGTVVDGDTFIVYIEELKTNGVSRSFDVSMQRFNKVSDGSSVVTPTIDQIITELAARVNADTNLAITATADTTGGQQHIDFLADNAGDAFEITVGGWDDAGDVVITVDTDAVKPVGSYAQVKELEDRVQQLKGYFQERDGLFPKPSNRAVSTDTYDIYEFDYIPVFGRGVANNGVAVQSDQEKKLVVACVDGDNDAAGQNQADFQKIITTLFGGVDLDVAAQDDDAADTA